MRATDLPRVVEDFVKHLEEGGHAIRAGEDDPVVRMGVLHELAELEQFLRRHDADGRQFEHIRAEAPQRRAQATGLLARARDHDALAKKRARLEPVQGLAQAHDIANHAHRRRFEAGGFDFRRNIRQRPAERLLAV